MTLINSYHRKIKYYTRFVVAVYKNLYWHQKNKGLDIRGRGFYCISTMTDSFIIALLRLSIKQRLKAGKIKFNRNV